MIDDALLRAILDDMLLVGVQPDVAIFNHLIRVSYKTAISPITRQ